MQTRNLVDLQKKSVDLLRHVEKPVIDFSDVKRKSDVVINSDGVRSLSVDVKRNGVIEKAISASDHLSRQANTGLLFIDEETVIKVNTLMTAFEAEQNFHEYVIEYIH